MARRAVSVEIFAAGDGINYPQKVRTEVDGPRFAGKFLLDLHRQRYSSTSYITCLRHKLKRWFEQQSRC